MNIVDAVYIHIPFCQTICSYCDFCKMFYNETLVNQYLIELEHEIRQSYKGEEIKTLYIGGGTPSCLNIHQLNRLFGIIKIFHLNQNYEYTFECNIDSINEEKLELLKNNGVNRISVGIQTFNNKFLEYLNRNHTKSLAINNLCLTKKYFRNINVDLMYAFKSQTIKDLDNDLDLLISLAIPHISTYSLIIEKNTKLYINHEQNIDEDLDYQMYQHIIQKLQKNDYIHYEISNFSKDGYESKHNLVYWNNLHYYGFGLGASGYLQDIHYENTRSINSYLKGNYRYDQHKLDNDETIENEFILGFRKIKGINKKEFYNKYKIDISNNEIVKKMLNANKLIDDGENVYINRDYIYLSNDILVEFLN
ncbi:MAG: radical SAM family heme chaperone HemW [Bacilli bacterium]|nr:radical SAM family heme chaperone HemW [Bacilli bacterium]